ncbi:Methylated-DNA--protein-cysteine methyltransferase [Paramagnetospirillum magnetotacticum MS-1]|uniref:Methylated-DNA--protein-cysteine methyltransferase n=1 Tax=Paramagnetospirillum magnetotacticum MS-1 TaxID=272627 RepID=A0A0C2U8P7_PARME|nr:methylated-DNA--[protein]-cysteine S-methyltransferase [Paramagnetospirillum magnetotacticum]KIL97872.1 Methylated-DNA--protein-cysteine methyltransferase [Paramagnetospirillum magnetotacticum MS-1]
MPQLAFNSPIGPLALFEADGAIVALDWGFLPENDETPLLLKARDQLEEYFDGKRTSFDLPLAPHGTAFQQKVWAALAKIPFGQTKSYGELAEQLGTAPRALGGACGRNPIPVIIPCHRVLGAKGAMGGYSGIDGIETKEFLLRHEGVAIP